MRWWRDDLAETLWTWLMLTVHHSPAKRLIVIYFIKQPDQVLYQKETVAKLSLLLWCVYDSVNYQSVCRGGLGACRCDLIPGRLLSFYCFQWVLAISIRIEFQQEGDLALWWVIGFHQLTGKMHQMATRVTTVSFCRVSWDSVKMCKTEHIYLFLTSKRWQFCFLFFCLFWPNFIYSLSGALGLLALR